MGVLRSVWIALIFAVSVIVLVTPAYATVTELVGDQSDKTYASDETMTLSGDGTSRDRAIIQLEIELPSGNTIYCAAVDHCNTPVADSRGEFTFSPILVSNIFNESGLYKFHVSDGPSKDIYTILVEYTGSTARILGSLLIIDNIDSKTTSAGATLTFDVEVTDRSHENVEYSLKSTSPPSAQISGDGVFSWTPSDSDIRSRPHKITIIATASSQTAEETVSITVNERRPVVITGVTSLSTDRLVYADSDNMILSGTTFGVASGTNLKMAITLIDETTHIGHTRVQSDNTFSFPPILVTNAFPTTSSGNVTYTITVSIPSTPDSKYEASVVRKDTKISYVGVALKLRDIQKQYATVGSPVSFDILPTDKSFTDLEYDLTGSFPKDARISNNGRFSWTPSTSDLNSNNDPKTHTITISAKSKTDDKSTEKQVIIEVRRAQGSTDGTRSGSSNADGTNSQPSRVTSLTANGSSFGKNQSLVISGTTVNADDRDIVSIQIVPTNTSGTIGKSFTRPILVSDNAFKLPPTKARDLFTRDGTYDVKAFTTEQGIENAETLNFEVENNLASIVFETPLKIASIARQSIDAGSTLKFRVETTSSSFDDLEWSFDGANLAGASINNNGIFTWPTLSTMPAPASFTITISATAGQQIDSRTVSIDVTVPAPTPKTTPRIQPTAKVPDTSTIPTPDPRFALTMTAGDDPQTYIDRYNNEPGYKTWFDTNFAGLSIQDATGYVPARAVDTSIPTPVDATPDPRFAATMTQGDDPQTYIDRYNNDPGYKTWFDANFAGLSIQDATGYVPARAVDTSIPTPVDATPDPRFAATMTQGDDPQTYIDRYNNDPGYKTWFDANFAGLSIQDATGYVPARAVDTSIPTSPVTIPTPPVETTPDPRFAATMTQGDDPQTYIDRYNNDPGYKTWFDANFAGLSIQDATGFARTMPPTSTVPTIPSPPEPVKVVPDPKFIPYMTDGDDPQTYIDRYNNDPGYKTWFDANFAGLSIQDATGYTAQSSIACPPGTALKGGKCVVITTKPVTGVGGCLIATATYGTEMASQVQSLREVRDSVLFTTSSGTEFMGAFNDVYYEFSPAIADTIRQSPEFRSIVNTLITPMLSSLAIMSLAEPGSESDVLTLGILVIALNIGLYVGAPTAIVFVMRTRK